MKLKNFLWIAIVFVGGALPANAGEAEGVCLAFSEANGLDTEPCSCIGEAIGDDEALLAEQAALETLEDFEGASDELKAAIESCTG